MSVMCMCRSMCATLLCCARLHRDAKRRKASELDRVSFPDPTFFYLFDRESCVQTETHTHTKMHIFIYKKKFNSPEKKGTFSRGRKRAGAQAPVYVYVWTCLWKLNTGLQATWAMSFSTLPPDSRTLVSK